MDNGSSNTSHKCYLEHWSHSVCCWHSGCMFLFNSINTVDLRSHCSRSPDKQTGFMRLDVLPKVTQTINHRATAQSR